MPEQLQLPFLVYQELLTFQEAARYLKVSHAGLRRLMKRGEVPYLKVGNLIRFRLTELRQLNAK